MGEKTVIDNTVFLDEWARLRYRFGRYPLRSTMEGSMDGIVRNGYFAHLSGRLTTEHFTLAAQHIFINDDTFPSPRRFLEAYSEVAEERIQHFIATVVSVIEAHGEDGYDELPSELQTVVGEKLWKRLNALGFVQRATALEDLEAFLRNEFLP